MSQYDVNTILKTLYYQAILAEAEGKSISTMVNAISVLLSKEDLAAAKETMLRELELKDKK